MPDLWHIAIMAGGIIAIAVLAIIGLLFFWWAISLYEDD